MYIYIYIHTYIQCCTQSLFWAYWYLYLIYLMGTSVNLKVKRDPIIVGSYSRILYYNITIWSIYISLKWASQPGLTSFYKPCSKTFLQKYGMQSSSSLSWSKFLVKHQLERSWNVGVGREDQRVWKKCIYIYR